MVVRLAEMANERERERERSRKQPYQLCSRNPSRTSGATQHAAASPLSVSRVRTYIRMGGHGGDRSKACLPVGYWQDKGGRAAAATAKAAAEAKELLEEEAAKAAATPTAGSSGPSTVMSSSRPAINCKQCNARLVSLD